MKLNLLAGLLLLCASTLHAQLPGFEPVRAQNPKAEALREAIFLAGEGDRLQADGKVEAAREKWLQAIEASRRAGDRLREAELYNKLGYSWLRSLDFLRSLEAFETTIGYLLQSGLAGAEVHSELIQQDFSFDAALLQRAEASLSRGLEAHDRGACEEALPHFEEAHQTFEKAGFGAGTAKAMLFTIACQIDPNDPRSMLRQLPTLWRALNLAAQLPVGNETAELHVKAEELHEQGRWGEARQLYDEVLQRYRNEEDLDGIVQIRLNLGALYAERGELSAARRELEGALADLNDIESPYREFNLAATHHNLTGVAMDLGQFHRALREGTLALELWQHLGRPDMELHTRTALGFCLGEIGALTDAQQMLDEARQLYEHLPPHPVHEALLVMNTAMVHYRRGQLREAMALLERLAQDELPPRHLKDRLGMLSNLAAVRMKFGRRVEALRALEVARRMTARLDGDKTFMSFLLDFNYAALLAKAGRWQEARTLLAELLEDPPAAMEGRYSQFSTLNLGLLSLGLGDSTEAESWLQQLGARSAGVEDAAFQRRLTLLWTLLRWRQERLPEARFFAHRGLVQSRQEPMIALFFRFLLSGIDFRQGKTEAAERHIHKALSLYEETLDDMALPTLVQGFTNVLPPTFLYSLASLMALYRGDSVEAFALNERGRALALQARWRQPGSHLDPEGEKPASLLRRLAATRSRLAYWNEQRDDAHADSKALTRKLDEGRRQYVQDLLRLELERPRLAELVRFEPVTLSEIQRSLPRDTTLIAYTVLDHPLMDQLPNLEGLPAFAWVVDSRQARWQMLPIHGPDVRKKVGWFRELLEARDPVAREAARELHATLLEPLLPHVRHGRLVIVPHGALHGLPFAALVDEQTGRHLVDRFILSYLPNATAVRHLSSLDVDRHRTGTAILGDPDGSLPHARREAREIAQITDGQLWTGAIATEARFRDQAGQAARLHVSSHGVLEAPNPLFSHLRLASDGEHDGFLEAHEILDLDLRGMELVVLNGCETGVGPVSLGDDVSSLGRAFLAAGADHVLDTQWPVRDDAAALLLKRFYEALEASGDAAEALRRAQLHARSEHPEPWFWAGFSLHGLGSP